MDFKELYEQWIQKSGGLNLAISKSYEKMMKDGNDESFTIQKVGGEPFKIGSLYYFKYMDLANIDRVIKTQELPYYDGKPFILALTYDKQYQYGLNLNVFPMPLRIELFDMLYKLYENQIIYNIGKEHKQWRDFKRLDGEMIMRRLFLKSKLAFNKYERRYMQNVNAIEWESNIIASTLFMKYNILYNKKKSLNQNEIFKIMMSR